ncbi:bactofilin family protein [Pelagibius sp.]|uniref:bactofilin family protein n=1 Tax=Pelagibius sp. TaxID=1931238 RepID=UPI003BAEEA97
MFGKRKSPSSSDQSPAKSSGETPAGTPAAGDGGAKAPLGVAAIKAPRRQADPRNPGTVEGRKLVVGREICLSGEIKTCEKLVVEGRVEADLNDSQSLEISEPGLFKGHATVEDCDVYGTFEGDLTVTGRLVIRPTGRVSGKIRYADIEIIKGGRLSGDIDVLEASLEGRLRGDGPKLAHSSDTPAGGAPDPEVDDSQSKAG